MIPTVHLNGTSRDELKQTYVAAYRAIGAAITAVQATAPNGRDYYVQGSDALGKAQEEHRSRLLRLSGVRDEILETFKALDQ